MTGSADTAVRSLRVAAVSPEIRIGDLAGNLRRIRAALGRAVQDGARLVVTPELATSGYVFRDRTEAGAASLDRDDPVWGELAAVLATGCVAVVGYSERDGPRLFNSAAVLTAGGRLGGYRKSHLWGAERRLFEPGPQAGSMFDTPVGRLGVAICYDNEFPEVPRRLALAGAELLALPVNWPLVDRPVGEHPPEVIQAMAAARSSRLATVVADRRGDERGVCWTGGSCVIDQDGWVRARGDLEVVQAVLTLRPAGDKSLPPYNDLFGDRRPELYS